MSPLYRGENLRLPERVNIAELRFPQGLKPTLILPWIYVRAEARTFQEMLFSKVHQCFFAGGALGAAKLTLGDSTRVTAASTARLRPPCATSLFPRVILPFAISESAIQRSNRARGTGKVPPSEAAGATEPWRHSKCSVPLADPARSAPV